MKKLDKPTVFACRNLHVADVTVFGKQIKHLLLRERNIEATNENSSICRIIKILDRGVLR